ncbi:MAG: hypothetical protein GF317_22935 [Candidatus Lokiarchaeota archaeon]|nr:hypothetical protein [Candidatus Lokiarchaeota archaeon]MBD3202303.1 hypothetical protein [Candidatus Lokiarchaeota archaeon]
MFSFGKDDQEKAEQDFERAEELFDALQYKKAGKYFTKAAERFIEMKDHKFATESYLQAANSYIHDDRHEDVIESLKNAANTSLEQTKFSEAQNYYSKALEYNENIQNSADRSRNFVHFSVMNFICHFIKGNKEEGLKVIKKIQKKVDTEYFKEHLLVHLVTNLTLAVREKKKAYLERIKKDLSKYTTTSNEKILILHAIMLADLQASLTPELKFDQEQYTTKELIALYIKLSGEQLQNISDKDLYPYQIEKLIIEDIKISLSDNFAVQTKPTYPLDLRPDDGLDVEFVFKPHFQKEESYIGPLKMICKIDDTFTLYIEERNENKIDLVAPPTHLDVSIKNLKTPLVGQTFPLEILIKNNSDGEASQVKVEATFPENLRVMRGTTEKQIYSIRKNEEVRWEINVKPMEAGEYEVKVDLTFKDPDQNEIKEENSFPVSIKL